MKLTLFKGPCTIPEVGHLNMHSNESAFVRPEFKSRYRCIQRCICQCQGAQI